MGQYTDSCLYDAETVSSEEDGDRLRERLLEVAKRFRGFDESLTDFLAAHGYTGDAADPKAKARFLRDKYQQAGIRLPRDFSAWFTPSKRLDRESLFQLCFAFRLSVEETEDFFRRVACSRGFDCHSVTEAAYYFSMRNRLSYPEAREILRQIPIPPREKVMPAGPVLYTNTIIRELDLLSDKNDFIKLVTGQLDDFRYNNATASGYVRELWLTIAKEGGLAEREGLDAGRPQERSARTDGGSDTKLRTAASTWRILCHILGLSGTSYEKDFSAGYDRSLTPVLNENALLPLKAAWCFPNRQNIDRILRGELVGDDEILRKLLILLRFYAAWAKLGGTHAAKPRDTKRCLNSIDNWLTDAGYPALYAGNPYDWIFLWAANDEYPLSAFRSYMGEVFAEGDSAGSPAPAKPGAEDPGV